jgi:hypothetical protein
MFTKLCMSFSDWCDAFKQFSDNITINTLPLLIIAGLSFCFKDIYTPVMIVIFVVLFDLLAKINAISYQARQEFIPENKWVLMGFIAAWKHDKFDSEPMLNKFWPKCKKYFWMMLAAGLLLKFFRSIEAYGFSEIAYSILLYIVLIEIKSIGRNLKAANNSLYHLFEWIVKMYYDRKGGTRPIDNIPEDRPKIGNH